MTMVAASGRPELFPSPPRGSNAVGRGSRSPRTVPVRGRSKAPKLTNNSIDVRSTMRTPSSGAAAATNAPAPPLLQLTDLPEAILTSVIHHLGPQSTLLGIGSTTPHLHSVSIQDGVWRYFYGLRCRTSLLNLGPTHGSGGGGGQRGGQQHSTITSSASSNTPSLLGRRWVESSTSFEGGQTPDETFLALYRRLHTAAAVQLTPSSASARPVKTCNRSIGGATSLFDDVGATAIDEPSLLHVCGQPAFAWCDSPSCSRARCVRCCVNEDGGDNNGHGGPGGTDPTTTTRPRSTAAPAKLSAKLVAPIIVKCGWCQIRLCRNCAPGNLHYCDCCGRGSCLDCESTASVGMVRPCSSSSSAGTSSSSSSSSPTDKNSSSCSGNVCWECAAMVGKKEDAARIEHHGGGGRQSGSSSSSSSRSCRYTVNAFGSGKHFRDSAPRQTYCRGCAERRVGKLNLYKRLDMSPRMPS